MALALACSYLGVALLLFALFYWATEWSYPGTCAVGAALWLPLLVVFLCVHALPPGWCSPD